MKIRKHAVRIKFERVKCPLCKRKDDVVSIVAIMVEDEEGEIEKAVAKKIKEMKQDKTMCLKCGFRIKLSKAKKTSWKLLGKIEEEKKE